MSSVRYLVRDVDTAVIFYTQRLGFNLEQRMGPAFARVSKGDLNLWRSGPQSSAARPMPDGRLPERGGWNRFVLGFDNVVSMVARLKQAGVHVRNDRASGPGGKQIVVDDPDGNPVELFQAA